MGERAFLGLYSAVSFLTLGLVVWAFLAAPAGVIHWAVGDKLWIGATVMMWVASILLVGSLFGNPALPGPTDHNRAEARRQATRPAQGVFAITRHPMMWAFALWSLAHVLVMPSTANMILTGSIAFLALAGAKGQDIKKIHQMGTEWQGWQGRTSYLPFGQQMTGRASWSEAVPGFTVLVLGTALWLGATWAHHGIGAGVWRWIG